MSRRLVRLNRLHLAAVMLLMIQALLPMGHHVCCPGAGHGGQIDAAAGTPVAVMMDRDETDCPVCRMLAATELNGIPTPSAAGSEMPPTWYALPAPCLAGRTRAPPDTDGRSSRGPPAGS